MKRPRSLTDLETPSEINISPLIDIVFLLLIFFIVTTVFVEETGVKVSKPRAASAEDLDKRSILLAVTAEGQVYQGGRAIGMDGVQAVVGALLEDDPETPVVIRADAQAATETTVGVIDAAKLAGAASVSLATEKR